jgi:hypothetical protein
MANRRFIDFPIAASVGDNDIVLIWQDGLNKQTTKATLLQGSPQSLAGLTDVDIAGLTNGQILQYNSTLGKWENVDRTDINLSELGDVTIVAPTNGQVLVYNSSTSKWENSSGGYVPYTGAVTTVNLGAQSILAGTFVKSGGTSAQFLKADGSVDSTAYGTGSVTSVGLTMPSAFSVANSPITTAGTLAVTGAGTVAQYIRGDGSLADFPATTGGGASVSYYLNGSVSQGTIGGVAYLELNRMPVFGAGTDITRNSDGYIASFITDAGDPNKLEIPAGNWNLETYFSASSSGGNPSFYVELYKYNGSTFTLIASSATSPELIAFGTNLNPYFSTLAVPQTTLALTDRLALRYYVNTSGRTITLHTENNHLCQVITTFTTGLTALNGLTTQVQFFAVGTSGTDFAISSATDTHTFNLPTASATNRGALSAADWSTFNAKMPAITFNSPLFIASGGEVGITQASGSTNGFLSSTDWTTFNNKQNALTNPVTGTGTTNYLPKFTGASTIGNSNLINDASGNVGLGVTPSAWFSAYKVIQVGNTASFFGVGSQAYIANNAFVDSSDNFAYITSNSATLYRQNTGIHYWYNAASGTAGNAISFTQAMTLTSGGNLLVGTTTDGGARLQIVSTGIALNVATSNGQMANINSTNANGGYFTWQTSGTTIADIGTAQQIFGVGGNEIFGINGRGARAIAFGTNDTERMRITSSGNVGIGTTSPVSRLSVGGNGYSGRAITAIANNADYAITFQQDSSSGAGLQIFTTATTWGSFPLNISDGTSTQLRITSGGNLLVGTTTDAGFKLDVNGTGRFSGQLTGNSWFNVANTFGLTIRNAANTAFRTAVQMNSSNVLIFGQDSDITALTFGVGSEAMRITSGGELLISGTYNPFPSSGRGNITLNGTSSNIITFTNNSAVRGYFFHTGTNFEILNGTTGGALQFYTETTERMRITSGGNVLIGTSTNGASKLRISGLPTSSAGLSSGDIWNDSGTLKIA